MISKVLRENSILNKVLSTITGKKVQMAFEVNCFSSYRAWSDGLDFLRITFESRYKGDHTPLLNLFIGVFNFTILELGVYNIFHDDDEEDLDAPYKVEPIFPIKHGYQGKKVCGNCKNYGHNAPEHGLTSQCVLNGSGVMPEGYSCNPKYDDFDPFTPLGPGEDI